MPCTTEAEDHRRRKQKNSRFGVFPRVALRCVRFRELAIRTARRRKLAEINDAWLEMKEAANQAALRSLCGRLNVRRQRRQIEWRAQFVNFRFSISRFIHQIGGHFGGLGCLGDPKQDRRLTHEVLFSDHGLFPLVSQPPRIPCRSRAFVPCRMYKSELSGLGATSQNKPPPISN
jgi:hypothetical protein